MRAIDVLVNSINAQIKELNKSNFKIYDDENRNYYIYSIEYCKLNDRLIFNCKEEK